MVTEYKWQGNLVGGGYWLRKLRESQGLTQRELEARTGGAVNYANISQLEIGATSKPAMGMLCALGEALGVTPNEIAERYEWWHPREQQQRVEPEQMVYAKNVVERLSPGQRYSFLQSMEALARVYEQQIGK